LRTSLRYIAIPSTVDVIGEVCFRMGAALEGIWFEVGLKRVGIEKGAFRGTSLRHIVIPRNVRVLRERCFGCYVCGRTRSRTS